MSDILHRAAPAPDLTVSYGPSPEQVIDLRLPAVTPAPLIVFFHGGFWRPRFDRAHAGPLAHALAALGYVVAVPEYRRAGMAEEGWTGPFNDIAAACDQVTALAVPHGADPGRITWAGHSAGGHLALWAAARPQLPAGSGTADDQVPVEMSRAFPAGRLVEVPGAGHFDLIDPDSPAWGAVVEALGPLRPRA